MIQPHSSSLRRGRYSQAGGLYFVTKCALHDLSPAQRDEICDALQDQRRKEILRLHAFVIMPDHWHAVFSLGDKLTLSDVVHAMCRSASFPSRQRGERLAWQVGFHDHKVRAEEKLTDVVAYVEANPVNAALVGDAAGWRWSSAHERWAGQLDRAWLGWGRF